MSAKLKGIISLMPQGSQIFTTSLLVLSGISFACGGWFQYAGVANFGIPYIFSVIFLGVGVATFFASHKNADLLNSPPATYEDISRGIKLVAPYGALANSDALRGFGDMIAMAFHREPIPGVDGKILPDGSIDPGKQGEAQLVINAINNQTLQIKQGIVEHFQPPEIEAVVPAISSVLTAEMKSEVASTHSPSTTIPKDK
jgi:hypothetical protein